MNRLKVIILLVCLNIPVLLHVLGVDIGEKLSGSQPSIEAIPWDLDSFKRGNLAAGISKHVDAHFVGRSLLIRTRNQIDYTFFNEIHTQGVIEGDEGFLFELSYIEAATGVDAIDPSIFQARLALFDSSIHIPQLILLAPGKASFYREHIPDRYFWNKYQENANHRILSTLYKKRGDAVVDLGQWAHEHKKDAVTLFPKNGIHWSEFFISHALQEVTKHLPGIDYSVYDTVSTDPYGTDEDIEESMNLWLDLSDLDAQRALGKWKWDGKKQCKLLVIGDSYAWGLVKNQLLSKTHPQSEFWYYNRQRFGPNVENPGESISSYYTMHSLKDYFRILNTFDVVLWVSTDANYSVFPFSPPQVVYKNSLLWEDVNNSKVQ